MATSKNDKDRTVWPRRFEVAVERDRLKQFAECISRQTILLDKQELKVPTTFAAFWLAQSDVKAALLEATGNSYHETKNALLHLEQAIETIKPLQTGENYYLDVEVSTPGPDGRLDLSALVFDLNELLYVRLNGKFAILPLEVLGHE
jgi:hypothetical protein